MLPPLLEVTAFEWRRYKKYLIKNKQDETLPSDVHGKI